MQVSFERYLSQVRRPVGAGVMQCSKFISAQFSDQSGRSDVVPIGPGLGADPTKVPRLMPTLATRSFAPVINLIGQS